MTDSHFTPHSTQNRS